MRLKILLIICCVLLISCERKRDKTSENYQSFGKSIIADDAIIAKSMAAHYETMQEGDSINSKMKATIKDVCQVKGCWMTLDMGFGSEVMVKFKDYDFFVPKDISGKEVIVNGKAFVTEISVEALRHYADDAGKSPEEIAAIITPQRTYAFEADGVLVAK
ncbi:hypothetical protein MHTCC0001_33170 [Flavobacteriaceae bacterium MHTCC 0001]